MLLFTKRKTNFYENSCNGCHYLIYYSTQQSGFKQVPNLSWKQFADTFASKVAAINDDTADASIGNVTGSNGVNVFLGIGIGWTIAALKHAFTNSTFKVEPGSLAFSVTVYCVFAFVAIIVIVVRRNPYIGGELGGPRTAKIVTTTLLMCLWLGYLLLSAFESYCYIAGF